MTNEVPLKRIIAAILAADVVGYSRLMAEDEEGTLARLAAARTLFQDAVARFGGRVFNTAGDAILAVFPSAVEALRAGLLVQGGMDDLGRETDPQHRIRFRMGLTLGDVVEVEGDLLGDAVNAAARLEGLAEPGGLCLSRSLHEAVAGKVPVGFRDIGPQKLKNIPRPVHAFRVLMPNDPASAARLVRPRGRLVALGTALAAATAAAVGLGLYGRAERASPAGSAGNAGREAVASVGVAPVRQACFEDRVRLGGHVVPRREVEVRPEAEGARLVRTYAGLLDAVRAGQILADLRDPGAPDRAEAALRAPVDGLILAVSAPTGGWTSPGTEPLFRIASRGEMELKAEASASALARLAPGQIATVAALGGGSYEGRVRLVAQGVDPATQLGEVRLTLRSDSDASAAPRVGQAAGASVRIAERCGLAAPASAVSYGPDGPIVHVVAGGRVEARPVAVGLHSGREIEIREGLSAGEAVVARAGAFLREGDPVQPVVVPQEAAR